MYKLERRLQLGRWDTLGRILSALIPLWKGWEREVVPPGISYQGRMLRGTRQEGKGKVQS